MLYTILFFDNIDIKHILKKNGFTKDKIKDVIKKLKKGETINSSSKSIDMTLKILNNLTELAKKGHRSCDSEEEIRRSIQVLSKRTKNNPVLIGEPGVGKTAIVEEDHL